jgi:hypothetical protein
MKIIECEQNSPEWYAARLGKFTASNMDKIITPTGQASKQVDKYISQLIAEIITGEPQESWKGNVHSERGKTLEQEAADYYAMLKGVELQPIGFCLTDDEMIGCSPDRLVGDDGMLEIKTCLSTIMIEYYEKKDTEATLEQDHKPQTQTGLYVTQRKWIDTMLYSPGMKPIIVRSLRQGDFIMDMVRLTKAAHKSMQARLQALREKGMIDA